MSRHPDGGPSQAAMDREYAERLDLLEELAAKQGLPPETDPPPEAAHVGWSEKHGQGNGTNGKAPEEGRYDGRVIDVGRMLAEPDEAIPWRCNDLAADGYLTILAGRGGEGKSWMALALASGVARGKPAGGIDCRRGRALLFDAENGPKLITRRFRAAEVTADLAVQPVDAGGLKLSKDLDWFKRTIVGYRANLVVFDSLRVLSSGAKESDADEMEPIVTALKQLSRDTGAAVVLIHHRGKSELSDYRGSSVILDQADMLFTLGRVQGDPEGRTRRKVTTIKCRIEEEPAPRWVAIDADRSRGLVFVNEAEPFEAEDTARPGRDALRDQVLDALTGISQSATRIAKALGRHPKDGTVRRLLGDLEGEGLAEHRPDGWGVPTASPQGGGTPGTPPETPMNTGSQGVPTPLAPPLAPPAAGTPTEWCSCARPKPAADPENDRLYCMICGLPGWMG